MKAKYKGLTKEQAEVMLFKVDTHGLSYALTEGYLADLAKADTNLSNKYLDALTSIDALQDILEDLRNHFQIKVS